MDFRLLGPLELWDGPREIAVAGAKRRALLAVLLLQRNEVISRDRLVDLLWGEHPPPSAFHSLEVHVSKLRGVVSGDGSRLQTRAPGYVLRVEPGELDLERFERLAKDGRAALARGDAERAARVLREALSEVRGAPLAEFAFEPFAQAPMAQFAELRMAVVEDRVDADLALGRHTKLVGELEALVAAEPLRERRRRQLMLALYRCGRQAEALQAYRDARRVLVDELGIEPTRELRDLERAILRQEETLDAPRTGPPSPAARHLDGRALQRPADERARGGRRGRRFAAVGVLALAVAVAATLLVRGGGGSAGDLPFAPDTVGAIDPATGKPRVRVHIPGSPDRLVAARGAVWVVNDSSGTVAAIDPDRRQLESVMAPGGAPRDLAAGRGTLWTIDEQHRQLVEISTDYKRPTRRIPLRPGRAVVLPPGTAPFDPWVVAVGAGAAWVTDGSRTLTRVNPRNGRVTRTDLGTVLDGVTVSHGAVWAISGSGATVLRVDPSGRASPLRIPIVSKPGAQSPYPIAIEAGLGSIWVLNGNTATVTRIDPGQRGVAATIPVGIDHAPQRLAVGAGAVWVAGADGTLTRIDATTNDVDTTRLAKGLNDVAVAGGAVWVSAVGGYAAPFDAGRPAGAASSHPGIRALPTARCSPLYYRPGDRPQLLIASDLPLQGDSGPNGLQINAAIELRMRERGFRAGRFAIAFQACDDSTPTTVTTDEARCKANARAYTNDPSVVAVIGTFTSTCAIFEVPILNRAPAGPLAMISPSNTYVGLTRAGPGAAPGDPARYAPTGQRSYLRIVAPDDIQAAADALLAKRLGVRRAYVVSDSSPYGKGLAAAFRRAAARLGIQPAGTARWDRDRRLVEQIKDSRTDAVFLGGYPATGGDDLIVALRRQLSPSLRVLVPDGFFDRRNLARMGRAAERLFVSIAGPPLERLSEAGTRFARRLAAAIGERPYTYSVYAAQATDLVLDAIGRSEGTRASVARQLFATRVHNGILGSFAIDHRGDTTARAITIYRITHAQPRLWQVLQPPAALVGSR
jgi:DNA-binding SARP family transcriptional activator/ABC-type branched-subunit amino acid transport system substrate-binding protein/streptogramin lyase